MRKATQKTQGTSQHWHTKGTGGRASSGPRGSGEPRVKLDVLSERKSEALRRQINHRLDSDNHGQKQLKHSPKKTCFVKGVSFSIYNFHILTPLSTKRISTLKRGRGG